MYDPASGNSKWVSTGLFSGVETRSAHSLVATHRSDGVNRHALPPREKREREAKRTAKQIK